MKNESMADKAKRWRKMKKEGKSMEGFTMIDGKRSDAAFHEDMLDNPEAEAYSSAMAAKHKLDENE